jgi:uncharacterized membrane-anchored protein
MALLERRRSPRRHNGTERAEREEREAPPEAPIHGTARLGRRTKELVKRLGPADVAIIDHADLDRMAAEDLVATGVRAVVNVAPSSTGRYPNAGPLVLAEAGVRLVDAPGADLFESVHDGESIVVDGAEVRSSGAALATGELLTRERLQGELERLQERVDEALAAFAENTVAHVRQEGELLGGRIDLPETRTPFRDRQVLIVVRGPGYRKDLRSLRAYIHDVRPLIVGVDGGADAVIEEGLKPDVVLGDMDSASDAALRSGAELIVHAYPDGRAPGRDRLLRLGLEHVVIPAAGTSQDVAMLLAFEKGAALIVSVGAHFNLIEFLDKNRAGMSSTFLTRLRIGETLVDAKGVSRLYAPAVRGSHLAAFAGLSALVLVIVVLSSPALADFFELLWLKLRVMLDL